MLRQRTTVPLGILALLVAMSSARAQRGMGNMGSMMNMSHDSGTMAQMAIIHDLIMHHDQITRTVTNLPDGVRTVTESADPALAAELRTHVTSSVARVAATDDPGMPMESAALRTIYRNGDKIQTVLDTTARGIIVVQTSRDSTTVAALQQHASEVTDLVRDGMAAMQKAMRKTMQQPADSTKRSTPLRPPAKPAVRNERARW